MSSMIFALEYEKGKKTWIAAIMGLEKKHGLEREFIGSLGGRPKGKKGIAEYILDDGLFEVCEKGERGFIEIKNGEVLALTKEEALKVIDVLEAEKKKRQKVLDDALDQRLTNLAQESPIRFDSEGGFSQN